MSILPSLTDTDASASATPSSWALRRIAWIRRDTALSLSLIDRRMAYSSSDALSRTSPYLSSIPSILLRISGKDRTAEAMSLSNGYCPSLQPLKKFSILRRASSEVRSMAREGRSIWEKGLRSGTRKGMQSPKPDVGNDASNIRITLISSARPRRRPISPGSTDTASLSALSRP